MATREQDLQRHLAPLRLDEPVAMEMLVEPGRDLFDLVEAVTQALARPERPEYVLLEASGVADPAGIAVTFTDAGLRDRIRLDSITCVVDAEQVFAAPER